MNNHAVRGYALARPHQHDVARDQLRGVDFDFHAVAKHAGMPRKLLHETLDSGVRAPRGVAFQGFADQHDEHGFGGRQILSGCQCRDHRHANRQVRGDLTLQQSGDGGEERSIAGNQRQNSRRIDAGDGGESAGTFSNNRMPMNAA